MRASVTFVGNAPTSAAPAAAPGRTASAAAALRRLGGALKDLGYRFTTVTPATHERVNRRPENAWARDVRDVLGWSRPFRSGVLPTPLMDLLDAGRCAGTRRRRVAQPGAVLLVRR